MANNDINCFDRISALVERKKLDRVPVIPHIGEYVARISNISTRDFYFDYKKALEAHKWAKRVHGYDGGGGYWITEGVTWDFGGIVEYPTSPKICFPKVIKRPVTCPKDVENLKIPEIEESPAGLKIYEYHKICAEKGSGVGVSAGSPMNIVQSLTDIELLMRWIIKEPQLVHRLLRIATNYLLSRAERYVREFGAEKVSASASFPMECHALMSPKTFEKFSAPYIKEIFEKYTEMGIKIKSIHLCGDHNKNLSFWKNEIKLKPRTIISVGTEIDMIQLGKYFGDDYIIGGNVKNSTLQMGTPNDVYEESREIIKSMKYNPGGFILMPDCTLSYLTPSANLQAMIEAAKDFGKYD